VAGQYHAAPVATPLAVKPHAAVTRPALRLAATLLAALAAGCAAAGSAAQTEEARSTTGGREAVRETLVMVEKLARGPVRDEIIVSAKVDARTSVQVFPRLSGLQVTAVHFEEGDRVQEGEVLLELFDGNLRLAEQSARAAAEEARRGRERAALTLDEGRRKVERAERGAKKAEADLARVVDLGELVNRQEIEDKKLAATNAQDDLELARFAERGAQIAAQLAEIAVQKAGIEAERAATDLAWTKVRAPVTGVVAERAIFPGELSGTSMAAFVIADDSDLMLNLRVPQDSYLHVLAGQDVEVRPVTDPLRRFHGTVRAVNPVLDRSTGTVHVLCDLAEEPGVVPGLFCEARIITSARDAALLVSKRAVLYEDDQPVLFAVAEDGTAHKIAFVAGASTPTALEVVSDKAGSPVADDLVVVTVGQENLKDGAPVKVVADA
jgi:multidrug efflux pump subunit AcrA (membrane-fusion protein)